jgi:cysteinyl-tRNA synthetase
MEWHSPWGVGFPGWHTECVVMGADNLGVPFDIHCGGIDHISIHHTNEIAQAEAAYGVILANYWLHGEFLTLRDVKMSKSADNITLLSHLKEMGLNPLAYRYLCLNNHYRSKMVYSEESLNFAQTSLDKLYKKVGEFKKDEETKEKNQETFNEYKTKFLEHINNDLDMPGVLALVWELIKDENLSNNEKYKLLLDFDKVMGLRLSEVGYKISGQSDEYIIETHDENGMPLWTDDIGALPKEVMIKLENRKQCRINKNWKEADEIRKDLEKQGWAVEDADGKVIIKKI